MKLFKVLAIVIVIAGMAFQLNAQLDTAGISNWAKMYKSTASWEEGAFMAHATEHPDYGWGTYNMLTHGLIGDSIYIVKTVEGNYKRVWIREKPGYGNLLPGIQLVIISGQLYQYGMSRIQH